MPSKLERDLLSDPKFRVALTRGLRNLGEEAV